MGVALIKNKHIKSIQYDWDIGSTKPKFALLDDGTQVIVKLSNGPEGNLVLMNEYLCYRMAILLDIPMPKSGICIMDKNTEIIDINIASSVNYGYAFYSTFLPKTTKLVPSIINLMKNKEDFIKILLFDHIIFNSDRNEGNLLVQFYKNNITLKVIDHSHVFINQAIWDARCLETAIKENDLLNTRVLEDNKLLYNMFYTNISITREILEEQSLFFQKILNHDTIEKLIETIPKEWKPSSNDIKALIKYLDYRIKNLNVIVSTILNYIK